MSEKVIFPESPEAAEKVTETFWKTREGKYFSLKDEDIARWSGATHVKCECGEAAKKPYTKCEGCREKAEAERYRQLEKVKWDGETPICIYNGDKFLYSHDDVNGYCEYDCGGEVSPGELRLVLCERSEPRELDASEFFEGLYPDDESWDLPEEIYEAAKEFNEVVSSCKNEMTWEPTKVAVIL